MTPKRKCVLEFVKSYTEKNGYAPTYQEIADALGYCSMATVHKHITNLQAEGFLVREHNRSRTIKLISKKQRVLQLSPEWFESFHVIMCGCKPKPGAQLDMTGITLVEKR